MAFDPVRLTIAAGDSIPVAERVVSNQPYYIGGAAVSASASGLIAYRTVPEINVRQLEWRDRSGRLLGVVGEPDSQSPFNLELSPDEKIVALDRTVDNNRDIWLRVIRNGSPRRLTSGGTVRSDRYSPRTVFAWPSAPIPLTRSTCSIDP